MEEAAPLIGREKAAPGGAGWRWAPLQRRPSEPLALRWGRPANCPVSRGPPAPCLPEVGGRPGAFNFYLPVFPTGAALSRHVTGARTGFPMVVAAARVENGGFRGAAGEEGEARRGRYAAWPRGGCAWVGFTSAFPLGRRELGPGLGLPSPFPWGSGVTFFFFPLFFFPFTNLARLNMPRNELWCAFTAFRCHLQTKLQHARMSILVNLRKTFLRLTD